MPLRLLKTYAHYVIPPLCLICHTPTAVHGVVCGRCWVLLPFQDAPSVTVPAIDGLQSRALRVFSPFAYRGAIRPLILKFKHGSQTHLAGFFVQHMLRRLSLEPDAILVPVPLHRRRLLKRGYNQAALLAEEVAQKTGVAHKPSLLERIRHTPPQGYKSTKKRQANVHNAVVCPESLHDEVRGQNLWLVDDVCTSGATLHTCAKALYDAGAKTVSAMVVACRVSPKRLS